MTKSWPSRRREPQAVRKGDVREQQILDAAEKLLTTRGFVQMTIAEIAEAVGMTRSALYFYFASKQDILVALVARTVGALREGSADVLARPGPVAEVIAAALENTAQQWREHGVVMRAAVDFGSTVPEVDRVWTEAAHAIADAVAALLVRGGLSPGDAPDQAGAVARMLCWMVERSFYQASRISVEELDATRQSCESVWLRVLAAG
ncbi:DNA-binding transcriptional regulator, AcrR family [Mycolicibacterium rutilum]|uniref:DNA-binding transcriptional regulator, AcrR family n=1 Tax=Mycolicibacterium rutilum TaxID=370526 RepID=A0A1H6J0W7_MYCRU|nr:TetR/AcrR family transcriptional regulator [Mycolicibacterium rutilum]SEH53749.1 DNA-binding transcriptional regulator, AcrR family [Mycolicibacterium rutilum]